METIKTEYLHKNVKIKPVMFSLSFQQNSEWRMDDLVVAAHTAMIWTLNSLNKKGCRYKELNVLTIKRIDEQLSRLPPASIGVVPGD